MVLVVSSEGAGFTSTSIWLSKLSLLLMERINYFHETVQPILKYLPSQGAYFSSFILEEA